MRKNSEYQWRESDVENIATFTRPPPGTYYATLTLSESDGENFNIVAHLSDTT